MRRTALLLLLGVSLSCRDKDPAKSEERALEAAPAASQQAEPPQMKQGEPPQMKQALPTFGTARFRVSGNWEAAGNAGAVAWGSGKALGRLEMATPEDYRRQHKKAFIIQLHFADDFEPQRRTYPIAAKYLTTADTAGATLIVHEDAVTAFAAEPTGEVTFTEIGEHVQGRFRLEIHDVAKKSDRPQRSATVTGEFDAQRRR